MSTSGLGGLKNQDIPSLMLQMLCCIGFAGDIIPNEYVTEVSGTNFNVLEAVQRSGYRSLNYFANLRRLSFTKSQVRALICESRSLHYDFLLLHRVKSELINVDGDYGGVKWHHSLIFPFKIAMYGCPKNFDTISPENKIQVSRRFTRQPTGGSLVQVWKF